MQMESMLTRKLFACSEGFILCDDVYFCGVCFSQKFILDTLCANIAIPTTTEVLNDLK